MNQLLLNFLKPYIIFCSSATYSLIQNLESIDWISFWRGIYIDPHSVFTSFLGLYIIFFSLLILLSILASFSLNRVIGGIAVISWALPSILSMSGVFSANVYIPESYHINDGTMYVGDAISTLFNVFTVFILGWSTVTLFIHFLKIKKGFKEFYDHIWYIIGLTAAVIFVVESNTAFYKSELDMTENKISQNISLTLSQLNYAHSECLNERDNLFEAGISEKFCEWIPKAKFNYFWISEDNSFTRHLKNKDEIRELVPNSLLKDIEKFNQYICSSEKKVSNCNSISFEFGRFSNEFNWPNSRYALAIVPLNESLAMFWDQSTKNHSKIKKTEKNPNIKWFFYMVLGFIVGGKVANSSRVLAGEPKPVFRKWFMATKSLVVYLFSSTIKVCCGFQRLIHFFVINIKKVTLTNKSSGR